MDKENEALYFTIIAVNVKVKAKSGKGMGDAENLGINETNSAENTTEDKGANIKTKSEPLTSR